MAHVKFSASKSSKTDAALDTTVFALPLRLQQQQSQSNHHATPIYQVPAMACPVLWFVILDGTATSPLYWQTVHDLLLHTLQQQTSSSDDDEDMLPPYIHLSLLIVSDTHCSAFQLDSPVPHLQQYAIRSENNHHANWLLRSATPMDARHIAHTQTALRSLLDWNFFCTYQPNTDTGPYRGMPLPWILSSLTDSLMQHGHPVGQRPSTSTQQHTNNSMGLLPYAGAQISVFLAQPPVHPSMSNDTNGEGPSNISFGETSSIPPRGVKGGCALPIPDGELSSQTHAPTNSTANDWAPDQIPKETRKWINYYSDLGRQCADAACAVDVYACYDDSDHSPESDPSKDYIFGIPLLAGLKSAATGVYPLPHARDVLEQTWKSQFPWKRRGFGAELRIRMSPGYKVDTLSSATEDDDMPLAKLYHESGLYGNAFSVDEASLWTMASCQESTTMSIDIAAANEVPQKFYVESLGATIKLKPVVQTCLAYTTIDRVKRNDGSVQYFTTRRMRISSKSLGDPSQATIERIYNSLDPEALAVSLFHKLALASLQEGTSEVIPIAQEWLVELMQCVYLSAKQFSEEQEEESRNGLLPHRPSPEDMEDSGGNLPFVAHDRLLEEGMGGSDLTQTEVLLGYGHERLRSTALMIYLLLQSDAFNLQLNQDDRWAALSHLLCMPPHTLTRCLAPRLQLWSASSPDDAVVDLIELRRSAIDWAIQETQESPDDLFLFVDSPQEIMVVRASLVAQGGKSGLDTMNQIDEIPGLVKAIDVAVSSYGYSKSSPSVQYVLNESDTAGLSRFYDLVTVEERCLRSGSTNNDEGTNFGPWRESMADQVKNELDLSRDNTVPV